MEELEVVETCYSLLYAEEWTQPKLIERTTF